MDRKFLHLITRFILKFFTRLSVTGLHYIPDSGGGFICVNHLSILDPVIVFATLDRQDTTAMVASSHKKNVFLRTVVNMARGIWLNREETDTQAMRTAIHYVKNGGLLGISPEGTRSKTGAMQPPKPGVAYLASKAEAPIYPVAIMGTERVVEMWQKLHRPEITMKVGQPFYLQPVERKTRESDLQRNTDEIMCRIAVLLPERYRGVYADHPRVKELELAGCGN
jgi:1-acyl-sn-glycerol-3-phosphate acyltransferase